MTFRNVLISGPLNESGDLHTSYVANVHGQRTPSRFKIVSLTTTG